MAYNQLVCFVFTKCCFCSGVCESSSAMAVARSATRRSRHSERHSSGATCRTSLRLSQRSSPTTQRYIDTDSGISTCTDTHS